MPAIPAPAPRPPAQAGLRRACAGAAVLVAVLSMHAALLLGVPRAPEPASAATAPARAAPLRLVAVPPASALPKASLIAREAITPPPAARQPQPQRSVAKVLEVHAPAPSPPATPPAPAAAAALPLPAAAPTVPVYATRLPDSTVLHYALQRGARAGSAQLSWRRQGAAYELSLDAELQGQQVLGSTSRGGLDVDGVAPLRMTERRRSKDLRAVNFQRDAQIITFSGPQNEYALPPGAQDRLSWMVQLAAIIEAEPALALDATRVTLYVVGTRGDAEAWHFEVQGREALTLPAGAVAQALHLRREPTRPYDTRVDVWLDPQRQHLPVRVRFATVPDGQPTELKLAQALPP
jgi:hypothetical protein